MTKEYHIGAELHSETALRNNRLQSLYPNQILPVALGF